MTPPADMASSAHRPRSPRATLEVGARRCVLLGAILLCGACRAAPMRAPAQRSLPPAPQPMKEEKLPATDESRAPKPRPEVAPEPAATPDPQAVVASIGPSMSPQRAASLRLTDEGRRFLEAGDTTRALDRIEKGLKIDGSNPHAYYWLAQVHFQGGRLDQALAFSDKSIVFFTAEQSDWLPQAHTFRASILERSGRFRDARDAYRRAVEMEPGSVAARAGLARLGDPGAGGAVQE